MYESELEAIENMYATSDHIRCLQKCFSLLRRIDKRDINNFSIIFNCYYKIAFVYSLITQNNQAIFYAKHAFLYVQTDTERALLNWTLSCIYISISKWKAIKYINDAIKEYNDIGDFSLFCQASLHKNYLTNDADTMLSLIEDMKKFHLDADRMDLIYQDLTKVYINTNQILKAQCTLSKIKNYKLKTSLRTKIYQHVQKEG